jgi:hypothetical protein
MLLARFDGHSLLSIGGEYPIFASGADYARATRKNGESALILQAQSACKISAWNRRMHKWDAPCWGDL